MLFLCVCVCVFVCDCVGVVGTANGLGFHPHAKRGPTFFQHVSFVLYVCVCERVWALCQNASIALHNEESLPLACS